eukprot:6149020-Pleurochrysis_carterae.AAC.7
MPSSPCNLSCRMRTCVRVSVVELAPRDEGRRGARVALAGAGRAGRRRRGAAGRGEEGGRKGRLSARRREGKNKGEIEKGARRARATREVWTARACKSARTAGEGRRTRSQALFQTTYLPTCPCSFHSEDICLDRLCCGSLSVFEK